MLAHCTQRAFHVLRVHGLAARLLSPMSRRTLGDYLCFRTLCWVWSQHLLSNPVYVQSMNFPDFTLGEILPKNRRNQVAKEPLPCSIIPRILGCSDRFWEIFLNCSRTPQMISHMGITRDPLTTVSTTTLQRAIDSHPVFSISARLCGTPLKLRAAYRTDKLDHFSHSITSAICFR
jgi:hypothetical protein